MATAICRLCQSSSIKITNTLNDEIVVKFLDLIPSIVLSDDHSLTNKVCQLCFGKSKVLLGFLTKIKETQKKLESRRSPHGKAIDTLNQTPAQILKKLSVGGISVKKVVPKDPFSDADPIQAPENDLLEEMKPEYDDDDDEVLVLSDDDDSEEYFKPISYEPTASKYKKKRDDSDEDFVPYEIPKKRAKSSTLDDLNQPGRARKPTKEVFIDAPISFTCAKCKATFSDFDELTEHMKSKACVIDGPSSFQCPTCNKQLISQRSLSNHMRTHEPKEFVVCEACAKEFRNQFELDMHMESAHKRVVRSDCIYRCSKCNETFQSHLDLVEHMKELHAAGKDNTPRLCEICARECKNAKIYQAHMKNHRGARNHVCKECNKGFLKSFLLLQHMHVHTGIKSFACNVCDQKFAMKNSLRKHKCPEKTNHLNIVDSPLDSP